jgi:hypothetical protein
MTFLYGTNLELIYSMPVIGSTITTTTAHTMMTGNSGTNPPFQLPALGNIWSPSNMIGKGLMIVMGGGYDIASSTPTTMLLTLDGTVATVGITVAATGSVAFASSTTGLWQAQVWMTCVGTGTASTWYTTGELTCGPGNAETGAATALTYMFGNSVTAGIPQAVSLSNTTPYYPELYTTWATAPTAHVLSQFMVYGLD